MITIIHGTDTASSRKFFLDIKKRNPEQTIIDGKNVSLTDLVQIFEGGELFTQTKNFFIEGLFGKKKKNKELDMITDYLKNNESDNYLYVWEEGEISKTNLNTFKNPVIKLFRHPQSLFVFLESIKPGNGKVLIRLFHETIQISDAEMVFFMIVRQVRMLLALIEPSIEGIDELKRMAPWQKTKLQHQADFFEIDELKIIYAKLFDIEKDMKTGNLSMQVTDTIDFLLLDI